MSINHSSTLRPLMVVVALLVAGACGDGTAPIPNGPAVRYEALTLADPHILQQNASAPALETLQVSAWIVRGERQTIKVKYVEGDGSTEVVSFLKLDFHDSTLVAQADGSPLAVGDSVLVTVTIDPRLLLVQLEPTGLPFDPRRPARLRIGYEHADPDYNGDGVVNSTDDELRLQHLGMFRQQEAGQLWTQLRADHDTLHRSFRAELEHFSNYAIAW